MIFRKRCHPRTTRTGLALLIGAVLCLGCRSGIDDALENARTLQEMGQGPQAIELLRGVLAQDPAHPEANLLLGAALMQTGKHGLAAVHLRKAEEAEGHAIPAGLLLGSGFLANERFDDAVATATRVLERDPATTAALRIRGNAHLRTAHFDRSIEDAEAILAAHRDDAQALMMKGTALMGLEAHADAEQIFRRVKELGEAGGDAGAAARGCVALASFHAEGPGDHDAAKQGFEDCVEAYGTDPVVVRMATDYFDSRGDRDRSLAIVRRMAELAPQNPAARQELSRRLVLNGQTDEALTLLRDAAEREDDAVTWHALAAFHRTRGDRDPALEAIERAIERAGDGADTLRFFKADLLLDGGEIEAAEEVAQRIGPPVYRDLIRGRILLGQGDAQGALAAIEAGLERWPDNAGARFMAAQAARAMGDTERALAEYQHATRTHPGATDSAFIAASLHLQRGEFEAALAYASRHLRHRPTFSVDTVIVAARAQAALGAPDEARATLRRFSAERGVSAKIVATLASLVHDAEGPEAAIATLEGSGLELRAPENEIALRGLINLLLAEGQVEAATAQVSAALAARPDAATLHLLSAQIHGQTGDAAAARAGADRALELDPELAAAHSLLAALEMQAGRAEAALAAYDRAAALDPGDPEAAYAAAVALVSLERPDEAATRLRGVLTRHPGHAKSANDLAWYLAEREQDLDRALELAERAARINPTADMLDTLGFVQLRRGDAGAAEATFRSVLAEHGELAGTRYRLGLALEAQGRHGEARSAFEAALAAGPFAGDADARARLARSR